MNCSQPSLVTCLQLPQVNVTDIPTAFEEGQALVSHLIAVWREEDTGEVEEGVEQAPPPEQLSCSISSDGTWFPLPLTKVHTCLKNTPKST